MKQIDLDKSYFTSRTPRAVCSALSGIALISLWCILFPVTAFSQSEYAKDASTEINVKNADIAAVIRIFSKKTKRNYILDDRVKGKISIYLPGKISAEESIHILDSVLALKGFTTVPIGENLWKIVPSKEAIQSTIPTVKQNRKMKASSAVVTRLLPLKFVGADDAKTLLTPLVSAEGLLNAYTGTNSLIIIDSEDNIERLVEIVESIDVPFSDREMTIVSIEHADAVEIAETLSEILGESEDDNGSSSPNDVRARLREPTSSTSKSRTSPPSGGNAFASGATISPRTREPKIIPDERTNSIIVVADEDTTARIRALISQLDSEVDLSGFRFYVYRCKHANAEELADVLSGLSDEGGSTSRGSSTSSRTDRNTGSRERGNRFQRTQDRLSSQRRTPGRSRSEDQSDGGSGASVTFGEDLSITADPTTNSLIIYAGKTDYLKIVELLKQLDIKRRQVLVEAMLLEVVLDESLNNSVEFLASGGGKDGGVLAKSSFNNDLAALLEDPRQLTDFTIAAASSGTLTLPGDITIPTQTVLVNAAQQNSNVNILSAPNILATDNEQAEIVVGQNVPFLASTSTSGDNLNNTFNQIDRQDVGITLRITPQISSDNIVRLEIFTEVSNVILATLESDLGPTTTIRTSETVATAMDGQMIVIGGLMGDDITSSESGIPFLKDVPVLGHLFRSTSDVRKRTNLLIFITPRIIVNQFDARENTVEQATRTEDVLRSNEVRPFREDVLRSDKIDSVAEVTPFNSTDPGTIRPARKAASKKREQIVVSNTAPKKSLPNSAANTAPAGAQPLELHVKPKLPEPIFQHSSGAGSVSGHKKTQPAQNLKGSRFIVFKLSEPEAASALPFAGSDSSSIVGIVIPEGSNSQAKRFFKVGQGYRYKTDISSAPLQPLGVFMSRAEAASMHPELKNWYTLSPFEIMNLGRGPWIQG